MAIYALIFCVIIVYGALVDCNRYDDVEMGELIERTLDAARYYIAQKDARQAFVIVKHAICHPNATFSDRYRGYATLADVFNVSRHVNIVARTRVDITRTDRQLNDMVKYLLQEEYMDTGASLDDIYANEFDNRNMEDVLQLTRAEQVRWHAGRHETMITHRAAAIAYGQLGEYDSALEHFDICQQSDEGDDGHDCADKLDLTRRRRSQGHTAKIAELSSRIFAERTINAARVNFATIYELYRILRQAKSALTPTDRNNIMTIIFECRKYLYYNGWLTAEEAVDSAEVIWKDLLEAKQNFAVDTYRIFKKDAEFSEWRRNGSEYQFWEKRRMQQEESISVAAGQHKTCNASADTAECRFDRPFVLRFVTNGMALTNFGHVQHDALWPFIATHNIHKRFAERPNASIYVLDVGMFLLKILRLAFPEKSFVGFRRVEEVPFDAEEVIISGIGLTKFFDPNPIRASEMKEVRRHVMAVCSRELNGTRSEALDMLQKTNNKIRVLVVERNLTQDYRSSNDAKVEQDCLDDHPALKHYVDGGIWSQSVICSKRVLGSGRRSIKNFQEAIDVLRKSVPYYVEVIPFNPEMHSYCGQVLMFANAKVAIGQHGAAMSHIGYMSPGSVVFELENILNSIFHHIAEGTGLQYFGFHRYNSSMYTTQEVAHVTLNTEILASYVNSAVRRT